MAAAIVSVAGAAVAPPAHAGHAISIMVAAVIVGAAGLILLGLATRRHLELNRLPEPAPAIERPAVDAPADRSGVARALRILVAALAAGTAVLLLVTAVEHREALGPVAAFLAVAGSIEAAWALALVVRPGRRVAQGGLVLNAGVVGLTLVARWLGLAGLESDAAGGIAAQLAVATAFAAMAMAAVAWLEFGLPRATEARVRQFGSVISVAALPALSFVVLATIVVVGGTAFPAAQG